MEDLSADVSDLESVLDSLPDEEVDARFAMCKVSALVVKCYILVCSSLQIKPQTGHNMHLINILSSSKDYSILLLLT